MKRCPDMYRDDMALQNKIKPTIFTGFTYVLLCECYNLKETYIASVCTTIDQLRARCCGYSALYLTHFQQRYQPIPPPPTPQPHPAGPSHHHPHPQQQHPHHHIPRHHRSTEDFEFDTE